MRLKNKKGRGRWGCEYSPGSSSPQNEPGESSLLQSTTTRIIRDARRECEVIVREVFYVELSALFDEIMPFSCKANFLWVDTGSRNFIVAFRCLNSIGWGPMLNFMHKLETGI